MWVHSPDARRRSSLYVSVRHTHGVQSMQLPVAVGHIYLYNVAAHTLCPYDSEHDDPHATAVATAGDDRMTTVELSGQTTSVTYNLEMTHIDTIDVT